ARLPRGVEVVAPVPEAWARTAAELAGESDLVIDAVFGTGIRPPLRGAYPGLFRALNDAGRPCLAVDIPSGVDGDDGRVDPVAVAADRTVTIGLPKRGLLLPPGRDFTGALEVADIGFAEEVCARHAGCEHWLPRTDYLALLPPRRSWSHKYQCGTVLVVAGSRAFGGAAHLAGLGALRSGAGLVTMIVPEGIAVPVRVGLPEAIVAAVPETASGTIAPLGRAAFASLLGARRAVALGPGLGDDPATDGWVSDLLGNLDRPCVVDADGLGAFARLGQEPRFAHDQVVLTPHAGELARLVGRTSADVREGAVALAAELAARWQCVLMLKGSPTVIAAPDGRVFINASGDDALARGGSGDVLTGLVGGLLAQGLGALEAALLGAYVHGLAGTLAAQGQSTRAVLVREIAGALGPVFEAMEKEASADAALRERLWPVTGDA
ncbi:MAG: NAD(P)H-hydrate dehydratase, partial [Krumholzibacteria bacterium]|nr:NAD(P)H-hydrate dehydratase [Candidatus Krumholzibacteria bacterium]